MSDFLFRSGKPTFFLTAAQSSDFDALRANFATAHPTAVVRMVRGRKCRTLNGLFDELAAAFQFPLYFGENWDALWDLLGAGSVSWLGGDARLLMVADANLLLAEGTDTQFSALLSILTDCNEPLPNRADVSRRPFHVLFQIEPSQELYVQKRVHFLDRLSALNIEPTGL